MVKDIDNAFDHNMEFVFHLINRKITSSKKIIFLTEYPGSNFLLPPYLTGGKWDFQVANLLLASTANFEPCWMCATMDTFYRATWGALL